MKTILCIAITLMLTCCSQNEQSEKVIGNYQNRFSIIEGEQKIKNMWITVIRDELTGYQYIVVQVNTNVAITRRDGIFSR